MIFLLGSLYMTFENLRIYERIETQMAIQEACGGEPLECAGWDDSELELHSYVMHEIMYFMMVTMTTVGYGDFYPETTPGRILGMCIILVFFGFIATLLGHIAKITTLTSPYTRGVYLKADQNTKHILLMGNAPPGTIDLFLRECFHADHGAQELDVIIMREGPPNEQITKILRSP
jgi:hypothetical protein